MLNTDILFLNNKFTEKTAFLNDDIRKIISNLVVDKTNKDKFHIYGKFMPVIEADVSKHEKTSVLLSRTLCSENCGYTIIIQNDPFEEKESTKEYNDALISIPNSHTHSGIVRLNGQLSEETAQVIKHSYNGSSKNTN